MLGVWIKIFKERDSPESPNSINEGVLSLFPQFDLGIGTGLLAILSL